MRANRIITMLVGAAVLGGCAYGKISRVPDEMIAEPEADRDLVAAIMAGELERADYLLATGADVDRRGAGGATPLIAAAMTDANGLAARLLELGADSTVVDDTDKNALAYALERDNEPLVMLLVDHARRTY